MGNIRQALPKDAHQLVLYFNKVGGESDNLTFGKGEFSLSEEEEERFLKSLENEKNATMILAEMDGEVISVGLLQGERKERLKHNAEISVSVAKSHWGKGIGREMMKSLIQYAEETNCIRWIHLGVNANNLRGIGLYESLGFTVVGRIPEYFCIRGNFEDEIRMIYKVDANRKEKRAYESGFIEREDTKL